MISWHSITSILTKWFCPKHVQGVLAFAAKGDSYFSVVALISLALFSRGECEFVVVEVVHVDVAAALAEITRALDGSLAGVIPSQGAINPANSGGKPLQRHLALPRTIEFNKHHFLILSQLQMTIAYIHGDLIAKHQSLQMSMGIARLIVWNAKA